MITPNWNAPAHIKALTTTRAGGFSKAPFNSNNMGMHVGDNAYMVAQNRAQLALELPQPPLWLDQQHTTDVVNNPPEQNSQAPIVADASYSQLPNTVCCVMTADCLPVLLTDKQGSQVAAVHAGWRGLCDGIIENAIAKFSGNPQDIIAWLGPAIGPLTFEVGDDVLNQFCQYYPSDKDCFKPHGDRFLANIYQLATNRLNRLGIFDISGGEFCTYQQQDLFFSYRREGQTGRMASLIWINK